MKDQIDKINKMEIMSLLDFSDKLEKESVLLKDKLKRRNTQIADLKNKVKERNKTINNCSICGEIMRQECINHKCKEFGKAVFKEITK